MKRYFMAGLAILLPAVLTIIITLFLVNLLTKPFKGMIDYIIRHFELTSFGSPEVVLIITKIVILFLLFFIILFLGFIAQLFFINTFFKLSDKIMTRIPFVNKIYKALQDVISTVFSANSNNFSQVVLVPFPKTTSYAIGLVTQADAPAGSDKEHMGMISVFVPGTPNPTMGFMLLFKREQIILLDMTVDEALRFVVSCGVMSNNFKELLPQHTPGG